MDYDYRLPRLLVGGDLKEGADLPLDQDMIHYLKNVLRRPDGSPLRVFNGRQGEFLAVFNALDRKRASLALQKQIRSQPALPHETHLVFALIKKDRMDFMIEKAVELGVTHFHPVLTHQTIIRDLNIERVQKQIAEAAEQSERLEVPVLLPLQKLEQTIAKWPSEFQIFAAVERESAPELKNVERSGPNALLIGPEGGFSTDEKAMLNKKDFILPVSFGDEILRSETAAIFGLSILKASKK